MGYLMHIYKNYARTKNQKTIRFIYKQPLFINKYQKDEHLNYFTHQCSKYLRESFLENDVYYLTRMTKTNKLKVWWKNLFLPITNKIILIPTMGKSGHVNQEYDYFVKEKEDWWSIAKKELGNGSKQYTLAEYNNQSIRHKLAYGDIIKIPFWLVNID